MAGGTSQLITLAALGIGGYLLWTNRGEIQAALDGFVAGAGAGGGGDVPAGAEEEYSEGGGGGEGAEAESGGGGGSETDVSGKGSCACSNGKCKGDCPAGGLDPHKMIADISRKAGRGGGGKSKGGGGGGGESYMGGQVGAVFGAPELQGFGFDELDMQMFADFPVDSLNSFYTELDPWAGYRDARKKYTSYYKRNKRYNQWYVPKVFG